MRRIRLKYLAGISLLATNLFLTSCGNANSEAEPLETEVEIEEKASTKSGVNTMIAESIESSTNAAIDLIQNLDEFTYERSIFEENVNNYELIYTEEFASTEEIYINYNAASNLYELTFEKGENKFELSLEDTELINFLIHQTSCIELTIDHDKDSKLISSLTTCDTLKEISINDSNINSLEGLSNLTSLERLSINNCKNISDLSPISNLTNLTWIGINGTNISDVSPLANLINLKNANLRCNEITNPEVLSDLEYLEGISLEFNRIESVDQLSSFVSKELLSEERAQGIIDSCETQRLSFAIDDYEEEATVLIITYFDSKESYFVEFRNDNSEIVKYALTDDTFDFYNLTKDTPNCTGIRLSNLPESFNHISICDEEKYDAMIIDHCDISNLYFVDDFDNLTYLCIENCPNLGSDALDFSFPSPYMRKLKTLIVKGTNISDFTPTSNFLSLEGIELKNNDITDYSFLTNLPNLKVAILSIDNYPVNYTPIETIEENGVNVKITGYLLPLPEDTIDDDEKSLGLTPEN